MSQMLNSIEYTTFKYSEPYLNASYSDFIKLKSYVVTNIPKTKQKIINGAIDEIAYRGKVSRVNVPILFEKIGVLKESNINERLESHSEAQMISHLEDEQDSFNRIFLCQNAILLLYPDENEYIDQESLTLFAQALLCPNNLKDEYNSRDYKSPKQLFVMWIIQNLKKNSSETRQPLWYLNSDGFMSPDLKEHENALIVELEAQLVNSTCVIFNEILEEAYLNDQRSAPVYSNSDLSSLAQTPVFAAGPTAENPFKKQKPSLSLRNSECNLFEEIQGNQDFNDKMVQFRKIFDDYQHIRTFWKEKTSTDFDPTPLDSNQESSHIDQLQAKIPTTTSQAQQQNLLHWRTDPLEPQTFLSTPHSENHGDMYLPNEEMKKMKWRTGEPTIGIHDQCENDVQNEE